MYAFVVRLLQPFLLLVLACGLGGILIWVKLPDSRRLLRWAVLPYVALLLVCTPVVAFFAAGMLEWRYPPLAARPRETQAIVVLGAGSIPPTRAESRTRLGVNGIRRCLRALETYRQGPPCPVLVSGGKVDETKPGATEAETMREFLCQVGVRPDDIICEDKSRTTYENAVESRRLLEVRGLTTILLVTDATHLPRATRCFEQQGLTVIPAGARYYTSEFQGEIWDFLPDPNAADTNGKVFHEWLGFVWYRLRGRL